MLHTKLSFAVLSVVLCACRNGDKPSAASEPAAAASSSQAGAGAAASSTAPATANPTASKAVASAAAQKAGSYKRSMADGRSAAQAKRWSDAVAAFDKALLEMPGDVRALTDLGYSAYHAGDLDLAKRKNREALAAASTPAQRAAVLFNQGMVEEKLQNAARAAELYAASLELRPSDIVQRRLAALGEQHSPCAKNFVDVEALCGCKSQFERDNVMLGPDVSGPRCTTPELHAVDGLRILRWGSGDVIGENVWFAAARGSGGWLQVAQLGTDYEPGAFGVHNSSKVDRIEERTVAGRRIAQIFWSEDNVDSNQGGLEIHSYSAQHVTLCVLDAQPRCPVSLALSETFELEYGEAASDTDEGAWLATAQKSEPAFKRVQHAEFSLSDAGVVSVRELKGEPRKELARYVKGVKLW